MSDTPTALSKQRRVLRPGGLFVFLEPEGVDSVGLVARVFPPAVKADTKARDDRSDPAVSEDDASGAADESSSTADEAFSRQAVVWQRVDTIFEPYITGIAKKP